MIVEPLLRVLESASWLAPLAAFLWGLASVALSPCHLSTLPLLVGFLRRLENQRLTAPKLVAVVTLGIALSLVAVAALSLAAGRIAGDLWGVGPWLMVVLLILAGLYLLGALEFPSMAPVGTAWIKPGVAGAFAAGGTLGLTQAPCTFAFFAPLLAFGSGPAPLPLTLATLGAFVAAHLGSTWAVGMLGARVSDWIRGGGRLASWLKKAIGVLAIAVAVDLVLTI